MTISQRVSDVRSALRQGKVGERVYVDQLDQILCAINDDPQAVEIRTCTVSGATNNKTYSIVINGVTVSYTSDASATIAEIAAGLRDAVNAEPLVRGQVSASATATTCVLTGLIAGTSFTATEADAQLSFALTQAAASADPIPFGRLVLSNGSDSDGELLCGLASTDLLVAQVDNLVVTYAVGEEYFVQIDVGGESYAVNVAATVDTDTTGAAIRDAINAMMPANTVIAAYDAPTDTISLTAEIAGLAFQTKIGLVSGTAARLVLSHATSGVSTDVEKLLLGISEYSFDEEVSSIGGESAQYPANAGVRAVRSGVVWVENSGSPTPSDSVFVELDPASADAGKFFTSGSATRIRLFKASWERDGRDAADNLAALRIAA